MYNYNDPVLAVKSLAGYLLNLIDIAIVRGNRICITFYDVAIVLVVNRIKKDVSLFGVVHMGDNKIYFNGESLKGFYWLTEVTNLIDTSVDLVTSRLN